METLENIHALTKRDDLRLQELKRIVKIKMKKPVESLKINGTIDDILYMRDRNKNKNQNTNERGFKMLYTLKNNAGKIVAAVTFSYVAYVVVSMLINAVSFAHKVSN